MKQTLAIFLVLFSVISNAQVNLHFSNPIDTGTGLNRVIVFPNASVYNGLDLDVIVSIDGYYSSEPSDTNWYNTVDFRGVAGDFNVKIPYLDTFTRCVDLTYTLVQHGTTNCIHSDFNTIIYDLDSSNLRNEYISTTGFQNFSLFNPTVITPQSASNETYFFSSDAVNNNNMAGAVSVNYTSTCTFSINYCVTANNNGGNSGFFLTADVETTNILALGDVVISDFKGYSDNCVNYLKWEVEKEVNLEHYVLQYSTDGVFFIDFTNIQVKNNKSYEYMAITYGISNYYRLKIPYVDGEVEYSNVLHIQSNCIGQNTKVFPNPCESKLNISSDYDMHLIELFDMYGFKISEIDMNGKKNGFLDLGGLNTGNLVLKITYIGGISKIFNLVKYL